MEFEMVYREDDMRMFLTKEQFEEYCGMSVDKQVVIAHLVMTGTSFDDAKKAS
jgi:hypothetical protein